jgi:hypothetical protein
MNIRRFSLEIRFCGDWAICGASLGTGREPAGMSPVIHGTADGLLRVGGWKTNDVPAGPRTFLRTLP